MRWTGCASALGGLCAVPNGGALLRLAWQCSVRAAQVAVARGRLCGPNQLAMRRRLRCSVAARPVLAGISQERPARTSVQPVWCVRRLRQRCAVDVCFAMRALAWTSRAFVCAPALVTTRAPWWPRARQAGIPSSSAAVHASGVRCRCAESARRRQRQRTHWFALGMGRIECDGASRQGAFAVASERELQPCDWHEQACASVAPQATLHCSLPRTRPPPGYEALTA